MTDPRVPVHPYSDEGEVFKLKELEEDVHEAFEEITNIEQFHASPLMVNVDFLELIDRYGEEEAWIILGKLKDLLG